MATTARRLRKRSPATGRGAKTRQRSNVRPAAIYEGVAQPWIFSIVGKRIKLHAPRWPRHLHACAVPSLGTPEGAGHFLFEIRSSTFGVRRSHSAPWRKDEKQED